MKSMKRTMAVLLAITVAAGGFVITPETAKAEVVCPEGKEYEVVLGGVISPSIIYLSSPAQGRGLRIICLSRRLLTTSITRSAARTMIPHFLVFFGISNKRPTTIHIMPSSPKEV